MGISITPSITWYCRAPPPEDLIRKARVEPENLHFQQAPRGHTLRPCEVEKTDSPKFTQNSARALTVQGKEGGGQVGEGRLLRP